MRMRVLFRGCLHYIQWEFFIFGNQLMMVRKKIPKYTSLPLSLIHISKSTGGTGLGLAIVKHVVAQHDASISLESEEGKGTKITVKFQPTGN